MFVPCSASSRQLPLLSHPPRTLSVAGAVDGEDDGEDKDGLMIGEDFSSTPILSQDPIQSLPNPSASCNQGPSPNEVPAQFSLLF